MSAFQIVQILFLIGTIIFISVALLHNQKINKEAGEILIDLNNYKIKFVCIGTLRVLLIFSIVMVVYSIYIGDFCNCGVIFLSQMIYLSSTTMSISKKSNTICENGMYITRFIKWENIKYYEIRDDFIELNINKPSTMQNIKIKGQDVEKIEKILDEKIFYVV